ncbi:hypothetical protein B0A53_06083 [Rhodotorula sp. CCFEE 5036]|nr:hypothetical protein B0A53_06083 [Rhodotorula sp. CCFEE 5036]
MGVRDLNAVAKRYAPESITTYASIRDFRGKTLAIDANLLTTKFHFANPYPLTEGDTTALDDELAGHRHARAWYYFLRRLKQNDINPIVVFDGATRLDAKARENERRRLAREVQRLRGEAELIRGERLRTIRAVLAGVDHHERDEFVESFRDKAREILDEQRAARSHRDQQDATARVGAVETELAKLDADRKRVRELIEAFERVVQAERVDSLTSIPAPPSASPSAVSSAEQEPSSSEADETSAQSCSSQKVTAPSQLTSPDADISVDETAGVAAAPDLRSEEKTRTPPLGPDQIPHPPVETVSEAFVSDRGPPPLETTPVLRDSASPPAASEPLSPPKPETETEPEPAPAVPSASTPLGSESIAATPERGSADLDIREGEAVARTAVPGVVEEEEATPPSLDGEVDRISQTAEAPSTELGIEGPSLSQHTVPDQPLAQEPATQPGPPPPPPPATSSPAQTLASLFEAHLADATNPIYSRNQIDVFRREALFFSSLVRLATTTTTTTTTTGPAEVSSMDANVDASSTAIERMLNVTESQGEMAAGTAQPEVSREKEQDQEQVVPTENAPSSSDSMEQPPPPTTASYEDDLHPIIERSSELQQSHDQRSKGISAAAFREVRTLIEALGVPWLQPTPDHPHEAEGVCAALQQHGLADLVISEDTDVVVYGAPVLRNITLADQPKVPMNVLDPVKLREALGMSKAEFVDLAILLGTDFTERIKGLGPVSALKAVRKYRSIENVLVAVSDRFRLNETFTAAYLATAQTARDIFLNLPPLPGADPLSPATSDRPALIIEDDVDLEAAALSGVAEPTTYFGTLQPTEPSPILPLLLAKYRVRNVSPSLEYDGFLDDDDDIGSTLVEEMDDVEFDWGDLDELDVNLVAGTGTLDDVVENGDCAEDSTLPERDVVATTSTPPPVFPSLDTTFERLYL